MNEQANLYAAPMVENNKVSNGRPAPSNRSLTLYLALGTLAGFGILYTIHQGDQSGDLIREQPAIGIGMVLLTMATGLGAFTTCIMGVVEFFHSLWHLQVLRLGKVIAGLSLVVVPLVLESSRPSSSALQSQDVNNLRQIGLAMLNYESAHLHFPPLQGSAKSKNRKPTGQGLSWRVHILPFLDCDDLYRRFHLDEPWDSPHNLSLLPEMPEYYISHCVDGVVPRGKTLFLRPFGNGALAAGDGAKIGYGDIADGSSNTIMALQVNSSAAVEWTRPLDWYFDPNQPQRALGNKYEQIMVVLTDGSTHRYSQDSPNRPGISDRDFSALVTRSGGEEIDHDKL